MNTEVTAAFPIDVNGTGHRYMLKSGQEIRFLCKEKNENTGAFELVHDGTTNEEMIAVLIDRIGKMNAKLSCEENVRALDFLGTALHQLNSRTRARLSQNVENTPLPHTPIEP